MGSSRRLQGLLFCVAATSVLAAALFWSILKARGPSGESLSLAGRLGMSVYCSEDPFSVLAKDITKPSDDFMFCAHRQFTVLGERLSKVEAGSSQIKAQLVLGENFSVSCVFSPSTSGDVHEMKLMLEDHGFVDMNADGVWDMRVSYPPDPKVEVLFNGKWQEVTPDVTSEYRRKLKDGDFVEFDVSCGKWLDCPKNNASSARTGDE